MADSSFWIGVLCVMQMVQQVQTESGKILYVMKTNLHPGII